MLNLFCVIRLLLSQKYTYTFYSYIHLYLYKYIYEHKKAIDMGPKLQLLLEHKIYFLKLLCYWIINLGWLYVTSFVCLMIVAFL